MPKTILRNLFLLAAATIVGCGAPSEIGQEVAALTPTAPAHFKVAVVMCKFSDRTEEPFTVDKMREHFGPGGNYGLDRYFRDISYDRMDLTGTVVKGWYTIPLSYATAQTIRRPGIFECATAAQKDIYFPDYDGIIAVMNVNVDSGSAGTWTNWALNGVAKNYPVMNTSPSALGNTFDGHEMGHMLGLNHSFSRNSDGTTTEYGDPFDIMSAFSVYYDLTPAAPAGVDTFAAIGPEMNAPYRERLGWLRGSEIQTLSNRGSTPTLSTVVHLSALEGAGPGVREVKIPIGTDPSHYLTLEHRVQSYWQRQFPAHTVLLHEVRADQTSYLVNSNNWHGTQPGESFADATDGVSISVAANAGGSADVTVSVACVDPSDDQQGDGPLCGHHLNACGVSVHSFCDDGQVCLANHCKTLPPRPCAPKGQNCK